MNKEENTFREIAWVLSTYIGNNQELLNATEAMMRFARTTVVKSPDGKATWDGFNWNFSHDYLVDVVASNDNILWLLKNGQKIAAIKELRKLVGCGLKAAKVAVEDSKIELALKVY